MVGYSLLTVQSLFVTTLVLKRQYEFLLPKRATRSRGRHAKPVNLTQICWPPKRSDTGSLPGQFPFSEVP